MMAKLDPIEQAIIDAARSVLIRRASTLRNDARRLTTTSLDANGREVVIVGPEGSTMLASATLYETCAAELDGGR